jgi:hypothetical protein
METTTLPLARYAEALAHVVHFGASAMQEVLARLDVAGAWEVSEQTWNARLVSGGPELHRVFAETFAATKGRLAAEVPALASIGPLPAPAPPEPVAETRVPVTDPPVAAEPPRLTQGAPMAPGVPTYLAVAPPAALVDLRGTVQGPGLPSGPALPFLAAASGWAARSAVARAAHPLAGTLDAPSMLPVPALPFVEAGRSTARALAPYQPSLTLQQYASLCVDLEAQEEHADGVLERYRLTPEQRDALDAHYQRLFVEQRSASTAFEGARQTYAAWRRAAKRGA